MKTAVLSIAILGVTMQASAQTVIYEAKIEKNQIPDVIINSVADDFPGDSAVEYVASPLEFEAGDVIVNSAIMSTENYDAFSITLSGKGQELVSTYDRNGNLKSTMEHMKNSTPPEPVRNTIANAYPGWTLKKDAFNLVQYANGKERERYRLILSKMNHRIIVYTDGSGKILNHPKVS